ncbi:hypothetical protein OBV_33730 [Oscillibacter valericigenes Sjm18-20]|nr:hypothetical protein OBV_33730 [Oscillibacter valericigenes Sjm18-20]
MSARFLSAESRVKVFPSPSHFRCHFDENAGKIRLSAIFCFSCPDFCDTLK